LARDNDGRIVGILPLVRLKSRLFGDFLISMPYFQRGGAIADHPGIEQKLMQAANDRAATLGIDHIEYRDDIPREALPARTEKVNMVLPLPDSPEKLWRGFTSKLRAQIKRPQREGPQILLGGKEYLDDFYRVYVRNMRDLGSMAHSKQLIQNILASFPEYSWIIVLYINHRPVAAGFLLGHGNTLEIPLASTVRDVNPLSMNMLLYWEVLRFAINHGFRYFDFGRSSIGAGTFRFKQQWGAQPKQLYWHYWMGKAGELPSLNPSNPKYALVISLWKRLPVTLTKWLGPLVVRNLP
jgi:FemAB-related protein (PEP-CTERM system-associated)